ncbi:MAG: mannose-1-phosphate guanylyltransferase/mannose-6-phosphate isomerase [Clostridiales bacterium]|jgi:mannose-1-phosphate guanylyltransferase/mannose-6-phosphate isomerase|nr:mannose-1-phosphate guanylyltransferase/mannose-6-phosphate isomerase [Clostridiales bacterium]
MKVLILAGGSGTRLWPLSLNKTPKPFLKLNLVEHTLFQQVILRSTKMVLPEDIYIIANERFEAHINEQLGELGINIPKENILFETVGKNTMPAVYYSAKYISQTRGDDILTVFPSDHTVDDNQDFFDSINAAAAIADRYLVTFGIVPAKPETGYGYIKQGYPIESGTGIAGFLVDEFKEKPDTKTAGEYIKKGYLWNSGMFMFNTKLFMEESERYAPQVTDAFKGADMLQGYKKSPAISIDYAILEKSKIVAVVPFKVKWNDLGNFANLMEEYPKDEKGNVKFLPSDVLIDTVGSMVYGTGKKTVLIGVEDIIVVETEDALLICKKDSAHKVKSYE